ncbi:MAG: DUF5703 domain-containing protein [Muribaculaceae bacterium]
MNIVKVKKKIVLLFALCLAFTAWAQGSYVDRYCVTWDTPSGNPSGSMPIGNGEVGANMWMEDNGNLLFYLSRTDSWSENSELLKLGRVRVTMHPALKGNDVKFTQHLDLDRGMINVTISQGNKEQKLNFWIDSEAPVVYVEGSSTHPVHVTVTPEIWRTQTYMIPKTEQHFNLQGCDIDSLQMVYPDQVASQGNRLTVYHRNEHSIFPFTMRHQRLDPDLTRFTDPIMHRTMGFSIAGDNFTLASPTMLCTEAPAKQFQLKVVAHTAQTATAGEWLSQAQKILNQAPEAAQSAQRTANYWHSLWQKSYLEIETPDQKTGFRLTQAYVLQRWVTACGARGNYPVKFNGSIFTVDPVYTQADKPHSPDYRAWGPDFWWQNTRLVYHPLLATGDFDMVKTLINHYERVLPMMKRNAEVLWNSKGAISPETATIYGTFDCRDFGWNPEKTEVIENPYVRYYWSSGLEIASIMADYYCYTLDQDFARNELVPTANEFLTFYWEFFPRDDRGKLLITPTHSLEMFWEDVTNDLPNVAGLHYLLGKLLQLPQDCATAQQRAWWKQMLAILPEIPTRKVDGKTIYSAAQTYKPTATNQENPELYVVFPFTLCHIGAKNLQQGIDTYNRRALRQMNGWTQNGQQAARLGLTEEAKANVVAKLDYAHRNHRFPVIWGPNFDWTPDQCHGSNLLLTLQDMVLQCYDGRAYVLPAFPADWNVRFKLYTTENGTVTGHYANSKWVEKPRLSPGSKHKLTVMVK